MTGWGDDNPTVIRVVRKKVEQGGHHGGTWKVAYADFVTAMMAFFLVMWIVGMDESAKDSVQSYFNDPAGYMKQSTSGNGVLPNGTSLFNTEASLAEFARIRRSREREQFEQIRDRLSAQLQADEALSGLSDQVSIAVTDEGLRIELEETSSGDTFFGSGSSVLTGAARGLLSTIGPEIAQVDNSVIVEGHTDATPLNRRGYTNWELSGDRANAARRALEASGLDGARVSEVRGYADRQLAHPENPRDPSNRRITLLLPFSGGMQAGG